MKPIRILLGRLIDYAGLFPPSALGMQRAVENYARYSAGRYSWALGRFVVPVSRLAEFEQAAAGANAPSVFLLSALAGADLAADIRSIVDFNARHSRPSGGAAARVDSVEIKAVHADVVEGAGGLIPPGIQAYFEAPISDEPAPLIEVIARVGGRAKTRTGGLTPESIPSAADLERFIRACSSAGLPFKATAGLHHPLRAEHRLTYDVDSPSATMHGFLNVFLASAFIHLHMEAAQAVRLLEERSIDAFRFDDEGVEWRSWRIRADQISAVRRTLALSFGSCSFEEPVEDLERLNLLDD